MSKFISVLSKIPNLATELRTINPNLSFLDIKENNKNELLKSEIIIADVDLLVNHINLIKNAQWIQTTWAGVDKLFPHFTPENFHSLIVTRYSGPHFGRLMSEYVVANIINHERHIFQMYENQKRGLWYKSDRMQQHRSIADLTIGILGIGQIGNYIAQILHKFGATVWGYGRRDKLPLNEKYEHYKEYCTSDKLPHMLKHCDYIINVLPSTKETIGLLKGDMLKNCSNRNTVFINIGRGSVISENDLLNALENKWISAAILDVFENEPLNENSALWYCDQVFITPHVAGISRPKDIAEQFRENYFLYENGKKIPTQLKLGNHY